MPLLPSSLLLLTLVSGADQRVRLEPRTQFLPSFVWPGWRWLPVPMEERLPLGSRVLSYPRGEELLEEAVHGIDGVQVLLRQMRATAKEGASATLNTAQRCAFNRELQSSLDVMEEVVGAIRFEDLPLLDGTEDVCLETVSGAVLPVDLPDVTVGGLGLSFVSTSNVSSANVAVYFLEEALSQTTAYREELIEAKASLTP